MVQEAINNGRQTDRHIYFYHVLIFEVETTNTIIKIKEFYLAGVKQVEGT